MEYSTDWESRISGDSEAFKWSWEVQIKCLVLCGLTLKCLLDRLIHCGVVVHRLNIAHLVPIDGHYGLFQLWPILNNIAMTSLYISFDATICISVGYLPRNRRKGCPV